MEQLQKAKYFSFSVDSTPDITGVDQLSLIVKFVQDNAEPVERFLCFLPNTGHIAENMLLATMNTFKTLNIDIDNCRGQSYDKASNMSEQYNGLQANIKDKCQYATYMMVKKPLQEYRSSHKRVINGKKRDDEYCEGEVLLLERDRFRVNTFFPLCNQFLGKLRMRKASYDAVTSNFPYQCKLDTMSEAKVRKWGFLKHFLTSHENKMSFMQLNLFIKQKDLKEAFRYTEIALRIFLYTAVTDCRAELKKIRNHSRSRISKERLNSLTILNMETDLTKSINYDSVIDEFVNRYIVFILLYGLFHY
ncbi:hypothetical protein ILUMI_26801 [Ignelater luminosus]|uniref:DUF4371 domain-containing protein n=1 Tax=Ignelater luminosus TaxID=2038154 RepID=A0A8K0C412_IGNLU|nr:hypothetical protein ILUMI_26801 [Ignelater luminosus]